MSWLIKILSFNWFYIFSRFGELHELEKPNDEKALNLMNDCATAVLEEYPDIVFSYGFGDEYRSSSYPPMNLLCFFLLLSYFWVPIMRHDVWSSANFFLVHFLVLCWRRKQSFTKGVPGAYSDYISVAFIILSFLSCLWSETGFSHLT